MNPTQTQPQLEHPETADLDMTRVLQALSDPQRLFMVRALASKDEPVRCGSLDLDLAKSTKTHHFRVLREAGVIRQWREGTAKLTELRRDDLDERFPGLLGAVLDADPASTA